MAYPTVNGPYGLKPVNLIGGQPFAGSTRMYPIRYGYAANIGFGDPVILVNGAINRGAITTDASGVAWVGVFMGCSYTSPATKQKLFSQFWPTGTLAGDGVAYVSDDPDAIYKVAVCSATTVIGATSESFIGQNMSLINNLPNTTTGNSQVAALAYSTTGAIPVTQQPLRVLDVVKETAVVTAVPYTSTSTVTITVPALTTALVAGSGVACVASNGQIMQSGAYTLAAYAIGATAIVLNVDPGATLLPNSAGTLIVTQYTEVIAKINFGSHRYNIAAAIA
jgi:hypothetical protein